MMKKIQIILIGYWKARITEALNRSRNGIFIRDNARHMGPFFVRNSIVIQSLHFRRDLNEGGILIMDARTIPHAGQILERCVSGRNVSHKCLTRQEGVGRRQNSDNGTGKPCFSHGSLIIPLKSCVK
jgi:hypothetical protein